ncbi:hypothetical protein GCM10020295_19590 [Streptomyces cinereospinus]
MATPPAAPLRVTLVNGGFEEPPVTNYEVLPDASQTQAAKRVPGWLTTASDHMIELWRSGFNGVPAAEGTQFAELNANQVSTLYQDLPTTPGTRLYWRLYHRGRQGRTPWRSTSARQGPWWSRGASPTATPPGVTTPAPIPFRRARR